MEGGRPIWTRTTVAAIAAAVGATLFFAPHLWSMGDVYHGDWRYFHFVNEAIRTSIAEYGQAPLWNPWGCGGYPLHANPQSAALSPLTPLMLLFGTNPGMKLYLWLHVWVGLMGCFALARQVGLRDAGTWFLPVAYATSSWFAWRLTGGQMPMAAGFLLPWALFFYLRARSHAWQWAVGAAFAIALMILEGSIVGVPMAFLFLGSVAVLDAALDRDWRPLVLVAGILAGGLVLASVKIVPVLDLLADRPRVIGTEDDRIGLSTLAAIFLDRRTDIWVDAAKDGPLRYRWWGEYGAYLGPVGIALLVAAVARHLRSQRKWLILMVLFVLVMMGTWGPWSPWELLKRLPIYNSLRVPTRYAMLVTLCAAIAGAAVLDRLGPWLRERGRARLAAVLPALLLAATAADLWTYGVRVLSTVGHEEVRPVDVRPAFRQEPGNAGEMERYVRANAGTVSCYEAGWIAPAKGIRTNRPSEAWPLESGTMDVATAAWSPNRIDLDVDVRVAGPLVVNVNHDRWWTASAGEVGVRDGVLAVDLPAGRHALTLSYEPLPFWIGLALSGVAVAVAVALVAGRARRRDQRQAVDPQVLQP